jgi:tetratricopeptide (TPR) repeat protein
MEEPAPAEEMALSESFEAPAMAAAPAPAMEDLCLDEESGGEPSEEGSAPGASIQLQKWSPDAPYLDRFRRTPDERLYHVYLEERPDYARSTAFFLDAADVFIERKQLALGLRVLSNLAEMELENPAVLRILGYRLLQAGRADLARGVFTQVKQLRPEEPQSYRDLAQACAALGDFQAAVELLWEVVSGKWDDRFPEIELIALIELNALVATCGQPLDLGRVDPRLLRSLPLELRVVLTWDADNTDIDLWVTDPNGEKASYANRLTYQGGRMSRDFREGYGPEEFSLRQARPGQYTVEANYYGNRQQIIAGATTLQLQFITGFGTSKQQEQRVTLRLREQRDVVTVGHFLVEGAKA